MLTPERDPVMRLRILKGVVVVLLAAVCLRVLLLLDGRFRTYDAMRERQDIYYSWLEGKRILSGENPYARILAGDMRHNDKYATYFPLFYLLSALTQLVGLDDPASWLCFWRSVFLLFHLGIGALIFAAFWRDTGPFVALIAAAFWLFNRWTLFVLQIAHLDPMALGLLVLSLVMFRKHTWASLLLFSASLATKQVAVFLVPLYLIWVWQSSGERPVRAVLVAAAAIASIPFVTSLPFLVWNPRGFVLSVVFSVTRLAGTQFGPPSVDTLLNVVGIPGRVPMLVLMAAVWYGALKRKIGRYTSVLLTMFAFLHFNAVLFTQYMAWTVPFIPLCLRDWLDRKPPDTSAVGETGAEAPSAHAGENASAEADTRASGSP